MRLERGEQMRVMDSADGGGTPINVTVDHSLGFAELLQVSTDDGRTGTVARKNNGDWWWIRPLDDKEVSG